MNYRKLLIPAILIGVVLGALLLLSSKETISPKVAVNNDGPSSDFGSQTRPPNPQTSPHGEESPAPVGSPTSLAPTALPQALPTLSEADRRPPPMPEWYDTAITDVPRESLDQGVDPTIGARTRTLPQRDKGSVLKVKFRNTGRCTLGDLDIIKDGMRAPGSKLLLTVEPLGLNKVEAAGASEVGLDTIEGNGAVEVLVSNPETPTVYGLYLCRDSDDSGLCGRKRLVPPGAPVEPGKEQSVKTSELLADPIWYFNPVVIRENKITAFKQPYKEPDYYKTLGAFISSIAPAAAAGQDAIEIIKDTNDIIRSGSLQLEGSEATIDLPKFEQKWCNELLPSARNASVSTPEGTKSPNSSGG